MHWRTRRRRYREQLTLRIRPLQLNVRGYNPILKRQNALDQTGQIRRPLGVADIRLDGANVDTAATEHVADGVSLDRSPVAVPVPWHWVPGQCGYPE